jgi:hypothetical protein
MEDVPQGEGWVKAKNARLLPEACEGAVPGQHGRVERVDADGRGRSPLTQSPDCTTASGGKAR